MRAALALMAIACAGVAFGAGITAGTALLLFEGEGLLGALGVLVGVSLAALAAGAWAGSSGEIPFPRRRARWTGVLVAFAVAATFAAFWTHGGAARLGDSGRALAVLLLLATPAYTAGVLLAALHDAARGAVPMAVAAAAASVALGTSLLIPRFDPENVYVGCAALLALGAALDPGPHRRRGPMNGKVVIVTGVGARGQLGFALAAAFRDAGASVAVADLNPGVHELAAELGDGTLAIAANLADDVECAGVVAHVLERFRRIDALVNAAGGLSVIKPVAETSAEEWQRELDRNARTTLLMSRAALPALRETRGAIVNFASPAALRPSAGLGAYAAGKAAVVALTRTTALEERKHGVRVNAVAPGMIDTEQNRGASPDAPDSAFVPREDVAGVVLFLAGDAARAVSGEVVHVLGDGLQ